MVISINWDGLLEESLAAVGKDCVYDRGDDSAVTFSQLHASVNRLACVGSSRLSEAACAAGDATTLSSTRKAARVEITREDASTPISGVAWTHRYAARRQSD